MELTGVLSTMLRRRLVETSEPVRSGRPCVTLMVCEVVTELLEVSVSMMALEVLTLATREYVPEGKPMGSEKPRSKVLV